MCCIKIKKNTTDLTNDSDENKKRKVIKKSFAKRKLILGDYKRCLKATKLEKIKPAGKISLMSKS